MTQQLTAPRAVAPDHRPGRKPGPVAYLWLVWRQHGGTLVTAAVATAGICTALLFAGRMLASTHCTPDPSSFSGSYAPGGCSAVASANLHLYETAHWLLRATVLLPVVLGVFWGAPLVSREYETGTYGLAWSQGVTARQWLRGKLLVLSAVGSLLCFATWWCARPVAASLSRLEAVPRFGWEAFATLAPLTVPYSLAGLAVGVVCSVLLKKTLPAMALAAVACLGLGVGTADLLRPHYLPPKVAHYPAAEAGPPFSQTALYLTYNGWADADGRPTDYFPKQCAQPSDPCLRAHGISGRISVYQPGSREAKFQLIEAGLVLLVAGLGCSLALWWIRPARPRRVAYGARRPLPASPLPTTAVALSPALRPALRKPRLGSYLWLVWRQHGGLLVWSVVAVATLCAALVLAQSDLATIHCTHPWDGWLAAGQCRGVAIDHVTLYTWSSRLLEAVVFAPVVLGVLWGAPLVAREYERGTQDLAWGQAISARRWLAGKLTALALLAVALSLPLWLCARLVAGSMVRVAPWKVGEAFGWVPFATLSPLLVPYSLVALAVGVLSSVLLRKTIPAIVVTALVCVGLGVGTADLLRPHYLPATTAYAPISVHGGGPSDAHNALYLEQFGFADAAGRQVTPSPLMFNCPSNDPQCLDRIGITQTMSRYQPSSREAEFQWIEGALALGLAVGFGSLAVRRLRIR